MKVVKYMNLYLSFFLVNMKSIVIYRLDFIIGVISSLLMQLSSLFFVWTLFSKINIISGWTFYEVTFIYGLLTICRAINKMFFDNLWALGTEYIREGKLDVLLLRPISPLFHLLANKFQQDGLTSLLLGFIILIKSLYELKWELSFFNIFFLLLFIIAGTIIFVEVNLITASTSFWIINSYHLTWAIYSISEFALYPMNIYPKVIQVILSFVIPYGFVSFYPANFFLNKESAKYAMYIPIIIGILSIISLGIWKKGLKSYSSTGS